MARPKKTEETEEKKTTARKTATRKTATRKTTTAKKTAKAESETNETNEKIAEQEKEIAGLLDLVKEMKSEIENLKQNNANSVYNSNRDNAMFKRVKCVNTINSILEVSTRSDGTGRRYTFRNYGESLLIRLDELTDIYATCPDIIRNGYLYICDRETVELLGLDDIYDNLYNINDINKIVELDEDLSVDKILSTSKSLRDEILGTIIKNIAKGKVYDLNRIAKLNSAFKIDINKEAQEYKDVYVDSNIDK